MSVVQSGDFWAFVGTLSSGAYKKGQKRYQPIGGAAHLTEKGQKFLVDNFGAENFHQSAEGGIDARFEVDDAHLDAIFAFFMQRDPANFETDPRREIIEELSTVELKASGDLPEIPAVLTPEEAESIEVEFYNHVVQPFSDGPGTSTLAKEGVPSRRLFFQFDIWVSSHIYDKMACSPALKFLTREEMLTTEGGAHKGVTKDGVELADNFII